MQAPAVAVSLAGRRSAAPSLSDLAYSKSGPQRKYVVRNGLLREPVLQDGTVGAVMHKSGGRITSRPLSAPSTRRHPEWQEHTKHMKIPSPVLVGTPRAIADIVYTPCIYFIYSKTVGFYPCSSNISLSE